MDCCRSWPLEKQLDFSCASAAMNCTCSGARGGIRPVEAIQKLMTTTRRYQPVFAFSAR